MENDLVQRLWGYCTILRDDGFSNTEYVEQLTYLLFLKMAEERSKPPFLNLDPLPDEYSWSTLKAQTAERQLELYQRALLRLSERTDLFGTIYRNAISRFRDPYKFQRLVYEIDQLEWSKYESDVKGDAYEGLLERTASDAKSGAGQYFTPRSLVECIVEVMQPRQGDRVCDPACGTGGFLLSWMAWLRRLNTTVPENHRAPPVENVFGVELVESVARLCLMNLVLHGISGKSNPVKVADSLVRPSDDRYPVVLANPPFGKKSSFVIRGDEAEILGDSIVVRRDDFWATTSNKQLNFLQHIYTMLEEDGRAAVVLPDNVLFEGGAGETIRRRLLTQCDVHTLLRLPSGIFYAQGVKANVLFFDRKVACGKPQTDKLWVYDLRTNKRFTLKESPLQRADLDDFVRCFKPGDRQRREESERFSSFGYDELMRRDKANLDLFWLRDKSLENSADLPEPDVLAAEIVDDLESALAQISLIVGDLVEPTRTGTS